MRISVTWALLRSRSLCGAETAWRASERLTSFLQVNGGMVATHHFAEAPPAEARHDEAWVNRRAFTVTTPQDFESIWLISVCFWSFLPAYSLSAVTVCSSCYQLHLASACGHLVFTKSTGGCWLLDSSHSACWNRDSATWVMACNVCRTHCTDGPNRKIWTVSEPRASLATVLMHAGKQPSWCRAFLLHQRCWRILLEVPKFTEMQASVDQKDPEIPQDTTEAY